MSESLIKSKPDESGEWLHRPYIDGIKRPRWIRVMVEHGPSSGLFCRSLRQGGSIHCGFSEWKGKWIKLPNKKVKNGKHKIR